MLLQHVHVQVQQLVVPVIVGTMARKIFYTEEERGTLDGEKGQDEDLAVVLDQPMPHQHGNQDQDGHSVQHSTVDGISEQKRQVLL